MSLYNPIQPTELLYPVSGTISKVIYFDPTEIYKVITVDKYKRWQSIGTEVAFPSKEPGICACGCGKELTGRQKRWATQECNDFTYGVVRIIKGDMQFIKALMLCYLPHECCKCKREPYVTEPNCAAGIQVDHIIAVKNGGGACWLGNYQFICHNCHSYKTTTDNKLRNKSTPLPISDQW